jgi:hypothetical protein
LPLDRRCLWVAMPLNKFFGQSHTWDEGCNASTSKQHPVDAAAQGADTVQ